MGLAEVARQPPPALHVGDDRSDSILAVSVIRVLATMLLGNFAVLQRRVLLRRGEFFRKRGLERNEPRLLRLESLQDSVHVLCGRDLVENLRRIGGMVRIKDRGAHARVADAPGAGVPRIAQDRAGELQLCFRGLLLAQISGKVGRRIIARLESLAPNVAKKRDRAFGALHRLGAAGPDRLIIPALIKNLDRGLLRLAIDEPGQVAGDQCLQLRIRILLKSVWKFRR